MLSPFHQWWRYNSFQWIIYMALPRSGWMLLSTGPGHLRAGTTASCSFLYLIIMISASSVNHWAHEWVGERAFLQFYCDASSRVWVLSQQWSCGHKLFMSQPLWAIYTLIHEYEILLQEFPASPDLMIETVNPWLSFWMGKMNIFVKIVSQNIKICAF